MALQSGIALWCYPAPTLVNGANVPPVEYSAQIEALRFTTVNPGGYGQLTAILKVPDARIPRPELAMFSRMMLVAHGEAATGMPYGIGPWEITEPDIGLNKTDGEFIKLTALGLGNSLRDNPFNYNFVAQTVQQIGQWIITQHNSTNGVQRMLPVDPDLSLIFPDNPAGTYSPAYGGRNYEEIYTDICTLASNNNNIYTWWTQAHPLNVDSAGFPTLQMVAKLRDTATTHYQASVASDEVEEYDVTPSAERAYNAIAIAYNNGSGGVGIRVVTDPRRNGDYSQGTMPFRFRQLFRDLSGTSTVGSAAALAIANMYLQQYQNPSNKVRLLLRAVRDGQHGNPIPLWLVTALNHNIWINEMAVRGQTIPTGPTAGVNQFYVLQTTYTETASGEATLEIQGDNWYDRANAQIARLSLAADALLRGRGVTAVVQLPGAPITGQCGAGGVAASAGNTAGSGTNFPVTASNTPTSITLSALQNNNVSSESVQNITAVGFYLKVTATAAGVFDFAATYTTVGNCLLEVDEAVGTFAHHCDGCELAARQKHGCDAEVARCPDCQETATRRGLLLRTDLRYTQGTPGTSSLGFKCPDCGQFEGYTTSFTSANEVGSPGGESEHRVAQVRLIRAAMRGLGMEVRD